MNNFSKRIVALSLASTMTLSFSLGEASATSLEKGNTEVNDIQQSENNEQDLGVLDAYEVEETEKETRIYIKENDTEINVLIDKESDYVTYESDDLTAQEIDELEQFANGGSLQAAEENMITPFYTTGYTFVGTVHNELNVAGLSVSSVVAAITGSIRFSGPVGALVGNATDIVVGNFASIHYANHHYHSPAGQSAETRMQTFFFTSSNMNTNTQINTSPFNHAVNWYTNP